MNIPKRSRRLVSVEESIQHKALGVRRQQDADAECENVPQVQLASSRRLSQPSLAARWSSARSPQARRGPGVAWKLREMCYHPPQRPAEKLPQSSQALAVIGSSSGVHIPAASQQTLPVLGSRGANEARGRWRVQTGAAAGSRTPTCCLLLGLRMTSDPCSLLTLLTLLTLTQP